MQNIALSINKSIESIDTTTSLIYQDKIEDSYRQLECTLSILTNMINELSILKQQGYYTEFDENQLNEVLLNAMQALEKKDMLLVADIFEYELKEILTKLL